MKKGDVGYNFVMWIFIGFFILCLFLLLFPFLEYLLNGSFPIDEKYFSGNNLFVLIMSLVSLIILSYILFMYIVSTIGINLYKKIEKSIDKGNPPPNYALFVIRVVDLIIRVDKYLFSAFSFKKIKKKLSKLFNHK